MSSSFAPWYCRYILYKIPFLYKKQKCGNYHPFWDRLCFCLEGETDNEIIDLKTGEQYKRNGK